MPAAVLNCTYAESTSCITAAESMFPLNAVTEANDKLPLPSVLITWLLRPSDVGSFNPEIVAESAWKCPTTSAPESDTVNLRISPCVTCKLPAEFVVTLFGDSKIFVFPPFHLTPSPGPGSLKYKALTPVISPLLIAKLLPPLIVKPADVTLPLKVAESSPRTGPRIDKIVPACWSPILTVPPFVCKFNVSVPPFSRPIISFWSIIIFALLSGPIWKAWFVELKDASLVAVNLNLGAVILLPKVIVPLVKFESIIAWASAESKLTACTLASV